MFRYINMGMIYLGTGISYIDTRLNCKNVDMDEIPQWLLPLKVHVENVDMPTQLHTGVDSESNRSQLPRSGGNKFDGELKYCTT